MSKTYIIIGASAAGIGCVRTLQRFEPHTTILCIAQQHSLPYNKCLLANALAQGDVLAPTCSLFLLTQEEMNHSRTTYALGRTVISIDAQRQEIVLDNGATYHYDALCFATGTRAFIPPVFEVPLQGVVSFHTLADMLLVRQYIHEHNVQRVCVIGGGVTGLECADALMRLGLQVTLVEKNKRVLPRQPWSEGIDFLVGQAIKKGLRFIYSTQVTAVQESNGHVQELMLADGSSIQADMVVVAAGVRPNSEVAQAAGIVVDEERIVINKLFKTSIAGIYAAGDVATMEGNYSTTWADAMMQGMAAARAMVGEPLPYKSRKTVYATELFGFSVRIDEEFGVTIAFL